MTRFETRSTFDSTSAAGPMRQRQVRPPVLIGFVLAGLGTSTAHALPRDIAVRPQLPAEQTSAGAPVLPSEHAGRAIGELRRLTGFTWEKLARLFNVSRRSLHFWASGKAMTPSNEEHLLRLLAVVRKVDRGSASTTRAALLAPRGDGSIPFDLLAAGDYEGVLSSLGAGRARAPRPAKQSAEASAVRAPRPPEELVGALQDRVHPASGRLLAAKAVRAPGGK
jgi:DNA-binding transcriptional regulator YiaG